MVFAVRALGLRSTYSPSRIQSEPFGFSVVNGFIMPWRFKSITLKGLMLPRSLERSRSGQNACLGSWHKHRLGAGWSNWQSASKSVGLLISRNTHQTSFVCMLGVLGDAWGCSATHSRTLHTFPTLYSPYSRIWWSILNTLTSRTTFRMMFMRLHQLSSKISMDITIMSH